MLLIGLFLQDGSVKLEKFKDLDCVTAALQSTFAEDLTLQV